MALLVGILGAAPGQVAVAVPSADGARVAFAVTSAGVSQLWTMNADGSDPQALPGQPAGSNSDPASSPDGTRVAFASTQSGNSDIWVINLAGTNLTQLTTDPGSDTAPAWSPDGNTIAFQSDRSGNADVWLMNPNGSNQTQLTTNLHSDGQPAWFPTGTRIAFQSTRSGNADIWSVNASGLGIKHVTTSTAPDTQPSVSPNGLTIGFTSRRSNNTDIYTVPAVGGAATRVTASAAVDNQLAFSTDGRYLSFTSTRSGTAQIWRVPRPPGAAVQLTNATDPATASDWAPYAYPATAWATRLAGTSTRSNGAYAMTRSPDGSKVFATGGVVNSSGTPVDGLTIAYDSNGNQLWTQQFTGGDFGYGASYALAVSPDGSKVYVTGFVDDEIYTASYNTTNGALLAQHETFIGTYSAGFAIAVSPDGSTVYVAATAYNNSGLPFEAVTMSLTSSLVPGWMETLLKGDPVESQMRLSPSGDTLYWMGYHYGTPVTDYTKDDYLTAAYRTSDGNLNWSKTYNGPAGNEDDPWAMELSPDGTHVFVTGWSWSGAATKADQATVAYAASDGTQQWTNRFDSPNHNWNWGATIAVSPDGSTVYTGGSRARTVGSNLTNDYEGTSIDASDGSLNWSAFYNGPGDYTGNNGYDLVTSVNVAPDGSRIYLTGQSVRTGTSFDYTTVAYDTGGNRVWLARYNGPVGGADYVSYGATLSPDGSTLFVTGQSRGTLSWDVATIAWDVSCVVCAAELGDRRAAVVTRGRRPTGPPSWRGGGRISRQVALGHAQGAPVPGPVSWRSPVGVPTKTCQL